MLYLRNPEGRLRVSSISSRRPAQCTDIPRVVFSLEAWRDMGLVVEIGFGDNEISWYACVTRTETSGGMVYYVDRIHIPEQVNTPVTTTITDGCHDSFDMTGQEYAEATRSFWGHSHVDGIVDPSGTDENTAAGWAVSSAETVLVGIWWDNPDLPEQEIDEIRAKYSADAVLIRAIGNRHGDLRTDVFDFAKDLRFDRLPWELEGVRESRLKLIESINKQCWDSMSKREAAKQKRPTESVVDHQESLPEVAQEEGVAEVEAPTILEIEEQVLVPSSEPDGEDSAVSIEEDATEVAPVEVTESEPSPELIDLRVDVAGDGPFADLVSQELQGIFLPPITRRSKVEVYQRWKDFRTNASSWKSDAEVVVFLEWERSFFEVSVEEPESPAGKLFVLVGQTSGQSWLYLWEPSKSSQRINRILASTSGSMQKLSEEARRRCISQLSREVVGWCSSADKEESVFILFDEDGMPSRHDELLESFFDPEDEEDIENGDCLQ